MFDWDEVCQTREHAHRAKQKENWKHIFPISNFLSILNISFGKMWDSIQSYEKKNEKKGKQEWCIRREEEKKELSAYGRHQSIDNNFGRHWFTV